MDVNINNKNASRVKISIGNEEFDMIAIKTEGENPSWNYLTGACV